MSATWTPPTLHDALLRGDVDASALRVSAQSENPLCVCPVCGRTTQADMFVDTAAATPETRLYGERFGCDGCRERAFREGVITREEFVRRLGAPLAIVQKMRRRDERGW